MTHVIKAAPTPNNVTFYHNPDGSFFMYGHGGITIPEDEAQALAEYILKNLPLIG